MIHNEWRETRLKTINDISFIPQSVSELSCEKQEQDFQHNIDYF